jgi:hypothetical protein
MAVEFGGRNPARTARTALGADDIDVGRRTQPLSFDTAQFRVVAMTNSRVSIAMPFAA